MSTKNITFNEIVFKLQEPPIAQTEKPEVQESTNENKPPESYSCSIVKLHNHCENL